MKIESLLPEGCSYIPADVVKRDERTVVIDLNKQRLPNFGADFVLGLGVLEYLFDMPRVLKQLSRQVPEGVFSYHPMDQSPKKDRIALGWVNSLNEPELMAILKYSGYKTVTPHIYKTGLTFYYVHRERNVIKADTEYLL
ncbi:hypothetical protein ASF26_05100 [Methylobacterium sp. Leaf93]|nr:hypothetical protein ASF26_05100 [Methylobacterium sp. Leaf93]